MPTAHNGFHASLLIDGVKVTEYPSKNDMSPDLLDRYVQSQPGKEYEIEWGNSKPQGYYSDVRVYGTIDGKDIGNWAYRQGYKHAVKQSGRLSASGNSISPFLFSKIDAGESDDEDLTVDEATLKDLGVIKLKFHTCVYGKSHPKDYSRDIDEDQHKGLKIHEKRLKNVSDRTSFGAAKPHVSSSNSISVHNEHPRPFLVTNFYYLSAALLDLRGIKVEAPQDLEKPSSSTLQAKDSNAVASGSGSNAPGDVKPKLLKRKKHEVIVLGDGTSDDDSDSQVVKKEKKVKKEVKPIAKGEVLDLTSD